MVSFPEKYIDPNGQNFNCQLKEMTSILTNGSDLRSAKLLLVKKWAEILIDIAEEYRRLFNRELRF